MKKEGRDVHLRDDRDVRSGRMTTKTEGQKSEDRKMQDKGMRKGNDMIET